MTTLTDEQRDDIEQGVVTPHYVVDPVALAAALHTIDAQRERIAALEAEKSVLRAWRDGVVQKARWFAERDQPSLVIRGEEMLVPVEKYNEMAHHAWTFAGCIELLRMRIAALEAENARYVRTLAKHRDTLRKEES